MDRCLGLGAMVALVLVAGCTAAVSLRPTQPIRPASSSVSPVHSSRAIAHAKPRPVALCHAHSLVVHAGRESDGSSFAASGNVELTNIGRKPCRLSGVPTVAVLRSDGMSLGLKYRVTNNHPALRSAVLPVGKPGAASMDLVWLNWCGPRPGPLRIRIVLPHNRGTVIASFDGPPAYNFVPSCVSAARSSQLELMAAYLSGGR
jgi:hypothetical protein